MSKYTFISLIATIFTVVFVNCGGVQQVGGTGTETINTFIVLPDGSPAKGATAKVVNADGWLNDIYNNTSPVIKEGKADKNGYIELSFDSTPGLINLQIDHGNEGVLMPLNRTEWELLDTVYLQPSATFSGNVDENSSCRNVLLIAGTDYKSSVETGGAFDFNEVAPGGYAILCQADDNDISGNDALTLLPGTEVDNHEVIVAANRVLIDNFESGIGPTSLGRIFPAVGWYILTDSSYHYYDRNTGSWEAGFSIPIGTSSVSFRPQTEDDGNTYFTFETTLDKFSYYANAIFGIQFKKISRDGVDLSGMTGFSFRAGGTGTIRIRFETAVLDSVSDLVSHYTYALELPSDMESFTIPTDSLHIEKPTDKINDEKYPWEEVAKNLLRIEIGFSASVNVEGELLTLNFDDFYLDGVGITTLLPSTE